MNTEPKPNPGSDEAIRQGCQCPIYDNARGRGYMGVAGVFVFDARCQLHGWEEEPSNNDQITIK